MHKRPLRGAMVATARRSAAFYVPMLEFDAKAIVAEALRLEVDTGTNDSAMSHGQRQ